MPGLEVGQRFHAAGRIRRRRTQQLSQLMRGTGSKAAISSARKPCYFAERLFADRIVAFLEHKGRDTAQAKLAGAGTQCIKRFLHGVADKNQGPDPGLVTFAARVRKDFCDLGLAVQLSLVNFALVHLRCWG